MGSVTLLTQVVGGLDKKQHFRNKKWRPKKPRRPPGNRLKLRPRLPGRRAKPLLLCQIRTSTREAMSRRPTVGTVRSVICTLRCKTSCKKKQQLHNNLDHNIVNLVGFDPLFNKNYLLF